MQETTKVTIEARAPERAPDGKSVDQVYVIAGTPITVKWLRVPQVGTAAPFGISDPIFVVNDTGLEPICREEALRYRKRHAELLDSLLPPRIDG
jgi:hypothetical protein